jgi:carboxyl-terminal processing protease
MVVRAINAVAVLGSVAVCVAGGYALSRELSLGHSPAGTAVAATTTPVRTLTAVRTTLLQRYVRPLHEGDLPRRSLGRMLAALRDPYTVYYTPHEYASVRADLSGAYVGIGLRVAPGAGGLRVVDAEPNSPAAARGLSSGDSIVAIDGVPTRGLAFDAALSRLDGVAGTKVELRVQRGRRDLFDVHLVRVRVHPDAVTSTTVVWAGKRVRVITIASFSNGTAQAVRRLARGQARVVLDLRGDPGGLVDEAVATADIFVRAGRVLSWRGAHVAEHVVRADGSALPHMRLAVVVDGRSASAAEILASALQDNRRAKVYGSRTFGKGSMQAIEPLADGGALKLTVATYRTPAGRDLSARGVQPDVTAGSDALRRAVAALAAS